jgi:hypothetical protein
MHAFATATKPNRRTATGQGDRRRSPIGGGGLRLGSARDAAERNADTMAASALGGRAGMSSTKVTAPGNSQTSSVSAESTDAIARARASGGRPLPSAVRDSLESGFGRDFSQVRVHTDDRAHELSNSLRANAFTVGQDIFFNKGEYAPATQTGRHLLAHELSHTIQQQGSANIIQRSLWDHAKSAFYKVGCDIGVLDYPNPEGTWRDDPWMRQIREKKRNPYILAKGASGPSVKIMHQFLRRWICDNKSRLPENVMLPAGSVYNDVSVEAVKVYQRHLGFLKDDGKVGNLTLDTMDVELTGEPPAVDCNDFNLVRPTQPKIEKIPPVVFDRTHKVRLQPYVMRADASVQVDPNGSAAHSDWEFGYHQAVIHDLRIDRYEIGRIEREWAFNKPVRDADEGVKPPFYDHHYNATSFPRTIDIEDAPYRTSQVLLEFPISDKRLQFIELKMDLVTWLIARRKKDPIGAEPCYLDHFEWGLDWQFKRTSLNSGNKYEEVRAPGNYCPSVAVPGKGARTPDLSDKIAGKAEPTRSDTFPF